jgi:hypothetical protein
MREQEYELGLFLIRKICKGYFINKILQVELIQITFYLQRPK